MSKKKPAPVRATAAPVGNLSLEEKYALVADQTRLLGALIDEQRHRKGLSTYAMCVAIQRAEAIPHPNRVNGVLNANTDYRISTLLLLLNRVGVELVPFKDGKRLEWPKG